MKNTLLENAGKSSDVGLESDIKTIDNTGNTKDDVLRDIARRFRQANTNATIWAKVRDCPTHEEERERAG